MKFYLFSIAFILLLLCNGFHAEEVQRSFSKSMSDIKKALLKLPERLKNVIKEIPDDIDTAVDKIPHLIKKIPGGVKSIFDKIINAIWKRKPVLIKGLLSGVCNLDFKTIFDKTKQLPKISDINFELHDTNCGITKIPLSHADAIWDITDFKRKLDTVVIYPGWTSDKGKSNPIDHITKAYRCRGKHNILIVDGGNTLKTEYKNAAENAEIIGIFVAIALRKLSYHYNVDKIHLIGYSLGAHAASSTARYYEKISGRKLTRITGLDPAYDCFYVNEQLPGLRSHDAEFVDVIASDTKVLGSLYTGANVDYYIEDRKDPIKEVCYDAVCKYDRAIEYYAATVYPGNEHTYKAAKCNSGRRATMGILAEHLTNGNCTINVNNVIAFNGGKCGFC